MAPGKRFGLLLIAADEYAAPPGRLPSSLSARRLRDLLVARGAANAEPIVITRRDEAWAALERWARAEQERPPSSFVYLVGHGQSDGEVHWFTLPETRGAPGHGNAIRTSTLADLLLAEWERRQASPSSWVVVVLDCCASNVGVDNLVNEVTRSSFRRPRRLGLWPVTPQGASHSGRFVDALARCLDTFTENDTRIPLRELIRRVALELGGGLEPDGSLPDEAALDNPLRAAAPVTMTVETYAELRRLVAAAPAEVRSHFLAKAQGAEVGELAWHFCGREDELASLSSWLRDADRGLRVVTGEAGSGKSALLGQLVALADEELVDALTRAGLLRPPPSGTRPPPGVFDATVHLTGKTLPETVRDVAEATGLASAMDDPGDAGALVTRLGADPRRLTILVDALDEAQEPGEIASFLRRAAAADRVRVLAGTRRALDEGPDRPADPARRELLDALDVSDKDLLVVRPDLAATADYVRGRLLAARSPYAGQGALAGAIVEAVAGRDHPFLFARLATAELLARPAFATDDPALADLLAGGHRGVFAAAVERLRAEDPAVAVLLHALALSRGRGFPEAAGIWVAAARAMAPAGVAVADAAVRAALERAAVYVTLDGEAGQSTYRLAHQTFVEHFRTGAPAEPAHHRRIAAALRELVARDGGWAVANYYAVRYLPEHCVADADRVPPDGPGLTALATDAGWLRRALALLGADRLADVLAATNRTVRSSAVDAVARAVRRSRIALGADGDQLAAQLHARLKRETDPSIRSLVAGLDAIAPDTWLRSRTWGLPWEADLDTTYTLVGTVRALAFGRIDGQTVLAIGVDTGRPASPLDRVVFWNPRRGVAEDRVIDNDGRRVTALALAEVAGRPVAVIAAGYDSRLALVDLRSGQRREVELPGVAWSVAVETLGDSEVVATDVGAWDARTLQPLAMEDRPSIERVLAAANLEPEEPLAEGPYASTEVAGRSIVAALSQDSRRVHVWQVGPEARRLDRLDFAPVPIRTVAVGTVDDRLVVAAAADYTGTGLVMLRQVPRSLGEGAPSLSPKGAQILALFAGGPGGDVHALTNRPLAIARVRADGTLSGDPPLPECTPGIVTRALTGHEGPVTLSLDDGERRMIDAADLDIHGRRPARHGIGGRRRVERQTLQRDDPRTWPATATAYAIVGGRAVLAAGSYGGAVWLWDLERRALLAGPFADVPESLTLPDPMTKTGPGAPTPVTAVAMWSLDGRDVVATAHAGRVRLWEVATGEPRPAPDTGTTRVIALTLGPLAGRPALVTGSEGGVLTVWDAARNTALASIRLDARVDAVWVVRGADAVAALTEDRVLHLFDVVTRAAPEPPGE